MTEKNLEKHKEEKYTKKYKHRHKKLPATPTITTPTPPPPPLRRVAEGKGLLIPETPCGCSHRKEGRQTRISPTGGKKKVSSRRQKPAIYAKRDCVVLAVKWAGTAAMLYATNLCCFQWAGSMAMIYDTETVLLLVGWLNDHDLRHRDCIVLSGLAQWP